MAGGRGQRSVEASRDDDRRAPVDRPEIFYSHSSYLLAASPREAARAAAVDLARQLRRLVEESGLVQWLTAGVRPIRTVDDEVNDVEQLYRSLIGQLSPVMAMTAPDNIGG